MFTRRNVDITCFDWDRKPIQKLSAIQKLRFRNYDWETFPPDSETIPIQKLSRFRNYRDSETTIQKLPRFRNYHDSETIAIQARDLWLTSVLTMIQFVQCAWSWPVLNLKHTPSHRCFVSICVGFTLPFVCCFISSLFGYLSIYWKNLNCKASIYCIRSFESS